MKPKVLLVDDEKNVLAGYTRHLRTAFEVLTTTEPARGLEILDREKGVCVVVSDMRMPGMDGVEFLRAARAKYPDITRIMLTGNVDQKTAVDAVNEGWVFRFCNKPFSPEQLEAAIKAGVDYYNLVAAEKILLEQTLSGSVRVLVDVLSVVAPEAFKISRQLRKWASALKPHLKMQNAWELDLAAMLSPIGEIVVPPEVTAKHRAGRRLTPVELDILNRVPLIGSKLISNIPRLQNVSKIIYFQDKGYDGSGLPTDWVVGNDIPFGARVMKVLIDLLRVTKGTSPTARAFAEMDKRSKLYDPEILSTIRSYFLVEPDAKSVDAVLPTYELLSIAVAELRPGDRLVAHVTSEDGRLIMPMDEELSEAQVEKLANLAKITPLTQPVHVRRSSGPASAAA